MGSGGAYGQNGPADQFVLQVKQMLVASDITAMTVAPADVLQREKSHVPPEPRYAVANFAT
jgi:hypothetical protein